jgi:hypothetical protein
MIISTILIIIGWFWTGLFLLGTAILALSTLLFSQPFFLLPTLVCSFFMLVGWFLIIKGSRIKKRLSRFKNYGTIIGEQQNTTIEDLAKCTKQSLSQVQKDLQEMIDLNYFTNTYIDRQRGLLVKLDGQASTRLQPAIPVYSDKAEQFLLALTQADQAIKSPVISVQIWRIDALTKKILLVFEEKPNKAKQCHKFFSYYLPTTIKLLNAYSTLEKQGIDQSNIQETMQHIEKAVETIAIAFEKQLDSLFSEEALDISTDICVLETILQQDALA